MVRRNSTGFLLGALAVIGLMLAWPAEAQDCTNPQTQVEMTGCAALAAEAADAELNAVWQDVMVKVRGIDAAVALDPSNEEIMRDAQRAWIPFRDKACEAESTIARGGSMQSQLFFICLERLTRQRTEDLQIYLGVR